MSRRLASIRGDVDDAKGLCCSYCGQLIHVTAADPVVSANVFDETMRRLQRDFYAKTGQWGAYHARCGAELARERKRLDVERRERTRQKRSDAARARVMKEKEAS